jgi:hypothetical protein
MPTPRHVGKVAEERDAEGKQRLSARHAHYRSGLRSTPTSGALCDKRTSVLLSCMSPLLADIVAKVFLGCRRKILRTAGAFYARRREGPYHFIQNRSWISVRALKSEAAAGKSKDRLSRDF